MQETPTRPVKPQQPHKKKSGLSLAKLLSTRGGTLSVALVVAVIGAGALLVFLSRYRESVDDESKPVSVLVAKVGIEKGTPGDVIASTQLFETTTLPQSEIREEAITDPSTLRGQVATREIFAGQQLTEAEFVRKPDPVGGRLSRDQRAIAIPVDKNHGLLEAVDAGDHVDVLAGWNGQNGNGGVQSVLRVLVQDALVLDAPEQATGSSVTSRNNSNQGVIVRVNDKQAGAIAFASEFGKVWLALRPPAGARQSRPYIVTLPDLLRGLPPIRLDPRRARR